MFEPYKFTRTTDCRTAKYAETWCEGTFCAPECEETWREVIGVTAAAAAAAAWEAADLAAVDACDPNAAASAGKAADDAVNFLLAEPRCVS